jgi:hypothetical protein
MKSCQWRAYDHQRSFGRRYKEGAGTRTWVVRRLGLGLTPMGAMTIWSTATLLESAAKLPVVAPSLRLRRGNLSSRYLFQRPMMGPDTEPRQRATHSPKRQGGQLTDACPKEKEAKGAGDVVVRSQTIVIFGCDLRHTIERYRRRMRGKRTICCDNWATTSPRAVKALPAMARVQWGYASKDLL